MDLLFAAQTATWADEETSRIAGTPPGQSTKYKCGLGVTPWDQELHQWLQQTGQLWAIFAVYSSQQTWEVFSLCLRID